MATQPEDRQRIKQVIERARTLSTAERALFRNWRAGDRPRSDALWSERQMAVNSTEDVARAAGRFSNQVEDMDRAYQAVAASAGETRTISNFADDRGPVPDWDAAAQAAAVAVAALTVIDLIPRQMLELLLFPWQQFLTDDAG